MTYLLAPKQLQFLVESTAKINLAHGSVRAGKTMCSLFRFMQAVEKCPDDQIWMIGHTASTIYDNAIRLLLEARPPGIADPLCIFRPFLTWRAAARELLYKGKTIGTLGAKDSGAVGVIHGKTMSLCYCDEMTLFPDNIIDMIFTRLSNPWSMLFASMNPSHPSHRLKGWIDSAIKGDPQYYQLHFTIQDNPYLTQDFVEGIRKRLSGVAYKRLYLGQWTQAEGAIFDFFDRSEHVLRKPIRSADYFIAGIDYGTNNAFAAVVIGISTGKYAQEKPMWWVEDEYFWDHKVTERQKTSGEFADDMQKFFLPYGIQSIYMDPSAAAFRLDLQRRGMHVSKTKNDVVDGITKMTSMVKSGELFILQKCKNLIREIESYVWDPRAAKRGDDEPLKQDDHAIDALRYAVYSHIPTRFDQDAENFKRQQYLKERAQRDGRGFY